MEQNKLILPLAIVVAGVMVSGAIYFGMSNGNNSSGRADNKITDPKQSIQVDKVTDRDWVLGDRNAPIVIVEYSDLECPFCKVFHSTMKDIIEQNNGKVARVYRHFPIAQLHKKAMQEAEAVECAAEQGGSVAFWNYLDRVFEATNSNDSLDLALLPKFASEMGLNVTTFNACLSSGKHVAYIQKSIEGAVKAGARGTPYSIIIAKNGKMDIINGAEPLASIQAKIDALLK
jgi:protein-disulfide isomerase